ncbi:MAG: ribonuclease Z [Lachnospiraceae bacterium]|nr:ribonuclease Z [Lachnospiraceae bacterium]
MLDICLLGTGGMMPMPNRHLTSMMARYNGSDILIDCGEGTQIAMKKAGWSPNPIDTMLFTHYHADHISGLPGMLLGMGNSDRTETVTMVGPKGLERVVSSLRVIAPELPFDIKYIELSEKEEDIELNGYLIHAFRVNHNVPCYGYSLSIPRKGKFNVEAAKELGLPVQLWNPLQKGNEVEYEGKVYTPDMVMGSERKGIKVTYCTDTRPTASIVENAKGSDLFICEGMYGEPEKASKAKAYKHMTFYEAARMAAEADVGEMWLTHFSPSMPDGRRYMKEVKTIFPRSHLGKDGKMAELDFPEED